MRDYIHVNDLAEAHVLGLEYLSGGSSAKLNLGTGRGHSVREIISTIEKVTGQTVPTHAAPRRQGDPAELVADPRRAETLLHWKATRSLTNRRHRVELGATTLRVLEENLERQSAIDPAS